MTCLGERLKIIGQNIAPSFLVALGHYDVPTRDMGNCFAISINESAFHFHMELSNEN